MEKSEGSYFLEFVLNFIYFVILLLCSNIIYSNYQQISKYQIFFVKISSLILLIFIYYTIKYLIKNLLIIKKFYHKLEQIYKIFIVLTILIIVLFAYHYQEQIIKDVITEIDKIEFSRFNPIDFGFFQKTFEKNETKVQHEELKNQKEEDYQINILPFSFDAKKTELILHSLVNQEREKYNLKPLLWDEELAQIARKHSEDMAKNNFFSHKNLLGEEPTIRATKNGYWCFKVLPGNYNRYGISENIFKIGPISYFSFLEGALNEKIAKSALQAWMNSPGHKANILDPYNEKEGIGIFVFNNEVFITQNFC